MPRPLEANTSHNIGHADVDRGVSIRGCRVLVVEDEYFLAKDLEKALVAAGANVIGPIPDLMDALQHTVEGAFDVAIIDINLRGSHAYPIAEILQRHGVPFVFATGYTGATIPERFQHVTRWEKPYDTDALIAGVAQLCRRS